MLHIVKQFIFGLTMGLKSEFENQWRIDTASSTSDKSDKSEKTKEEILAIIEKNNSLKDGKLNKDDPVYDISLWENKINNQLATTLRDLWFNANDVNSDKGILISEIKARIEETFSKKEAAIKKATDEEAILKSDIDASLWIQADSNIAVDLTEGKANWLPKVINDFSKLNVSEYENYKFNKTVQDLQNFLISENLLPLEQKPGKSSADGKWWSDTREAYNNYLRLSTTQESEDIFSEEEKIIAEFDIRNDSNDEVKVLLLQKALNSRWEKLVVDGKFYRKDGKKSNTQAAFEKAEKSISDKVKTSQDGSSVTWVEETKRHSDIEKVKEQVEKTKQSVEDLTNKLLITSGLNKELEDIFFDRKKWYSIQKGLEALFGDKYEGLMNVDTVNQTQEKLAGNEDKIARALGYIAPARYATNWEKWSRTHNVVDHIMKAAPWLFGVYLGDLPLPFCKSLTWASNINKSASFVQWLNSDMDVEFKDYYKSEDKVAVLENQYSLRWLLSTLQLSEDDLNKYDTLGINGLNDEIKELFKVYLEHRLIVDMKLLDNQSFGLWDVLFDEKEDTSDNLLDTVIKESKNENGADYEKIDAMVINFLQNIRDEDDVDTKIIDSVDNRNDYMTEVMTQDQITQNISYLFSLWHTASLASILYKFDTPQDFINSGFNEDQSKDILVLYKAISEKNNEEVKQLTSKLENVFKDIFSDNHSDYLKSTIPTGKFEYINRWVAKHGIDLRTITDESKHYESATTTTADPTGKYSSLGLAYMSYLDKGALSWVTYEEFDESFKNKETIDTQKLIEELWNNPLINTWRKEDQENITTLQKLLEGKDNNKDTVIYKMEDITKSYTYYSESWEKITQTVTYNLYMRPECQNPLIIPNTITTVSQGHDVNFDPHTAVEVSNILPIVLAYDIFSGKWSGSQSTTTITEGLGDTTTTWTVAWNGGTSVSWGMFGSETITNTVTEWVKTSSKSYAELSLESTAKAAATVITWNAINDNLIKDNNKN